MFIINTTVKNNANARIESEGFILNAIQYEATTKSITNTDRLYITAEIMILIKQFC